MNSNKATPLAVTEFVKVVGSGRNQRVVVEGTTPDGETVRVFVEPRYPQLGSLGGGVVLALDRQVTNAEILAWYFSSRNSTTPRY